VAAGALLAAATLLFGRVPVEPEPDEWPAALRRVDRLLSVPFTLEPTFEARRVVFLAMVGLAWLGSGMAVLRTRGAAPGESVSAPRILHAAGIVVLAVGALSATAQGTWGPSLGWLLVFGAGWGWSAWLATRIDGRGIDAVAALTALLTAAALALSLWHRSALNLEWIVWPIGSVTASAFLGAICTTGFITGTAVLVRAGQWRRALVCAVGAVCGGAILWLSGRRGPLLGAALALFLATALHAWLGQRRRWPRAAVVVCALAIAGGSGWWVRAQARPTTVGRFSSILERFDFYAAGADLAREHPLLGVGPDLALAELTTRFAPLRSRMPQRYWADVVNAVHNEWLQAIVELGWAGGTAYFALPVAAIVAAWRRYGGGTDRLERARLAAVATALTALTASEATSVMMRSQMGPPWFWTLVGLLWALSLRGAPVRRPPAPRNGRAARAVTRLAAGAALWGLCVAAARSSHQHALALKMVPVDVEAVLAHLDRARWPFESLHWLAIRRSRGLALSTQLLDRRDVLYATPGADPAVVDPGAHEAFVALCRRTAAAWEEAYRVCPGAPDAGPRRAEALLWAGDETQGLALLQDYLERIAPFDRLANVLMARAAGSVDDQLEYLCRAIRNDQIERDVEPLLQALGPRFDGAERWAARVEAARRDAHRPVVEWGDPLTPEVLRIESWRLMQDGRRADGRDTAGLAVGAHGRLLMDPLRRGPMAECEAWHFLARLTYVNDPRDYGRAFEAMARAEEIAVRHGPLVRRRVEGDGGAEIVGGVLLPTKFPPNLQSMWAFSAFLRVAAGNLDDLGMRVYGALPAENRTPQAVRLVVADAAWKLHHDFAPFPPGQRPPNYDRYLDMVRRYNPALLEGPPPGRR